MISTDQAASLICSLDVKGRLEGEKFDSLEAKLRKAFSIAKSFWMSEDNSVRFNGALAGVMTTCTPEECDDIIYSKKELDKLDALLVAATRGLSVDMASMVEQIEKRKPLPLMRWYQDAVPS